MELQNQIITSELQVLRESAEMSRRTLRGSNGDVGIVGRLVNLELRFSKIESYVEKQMQSGSSDIDSKLAEAVDEDHVVRWSTIREKTLWPIVIIILLGVLWLLGNHGILPQP